MVRLICIATGIKSKKSSRYFLWCDYGNEQGFSPIRFFYACPVHLVFFSTRERSWRFWLGGLNIVGQNKASLSLLYSPFPSSFFQIWNVLWIVSCSSLGFDSIRPVVYRPHLGTVFVWVGVYPKENKNAHERKGENITTAPKYESLIQVLAGWLLLLLRFISRSTRKRRNAFL